MKLCDFHSHIVPAADHGSDSVQTSQAQIDIIAESGVREVVATPHFYAHHDTVESFLERREEAAGKILPYARERGIELHLGAEVLACPGMEHMEGLERLCIEGTNVLLLELPLTYWSNDLIDTVYSIGRKDMKVVMAHIDRYLDRDVSRIFEIPRLKYQINVSSLCRFRGRRDILSLIDEGMIFALGSDFHGTKGYRDFARAIKVMGESRAEEIFAKTEELLRSE